MFPLFVFFSVSTVTILHYRRPILQA